VSSTDNQPFHHRTFKHQVVSWVSRNVFDHVTYTVRRGLLKGLRRKGGLAWIPELGSAEPSEEDKFLSNLDLQGKTVFDIGAFEGLLTMFFARKASHVVCYEPNPRNSSKVRANLALNQMNNVTLRQFGLADKGGDAVMVWHPSTAGFSTMEHTGIDAADSSRSSQRAEIRLTTLDQDMIDASLPSPDFIKIDVEGFELPVLQGARKLLETSHPALFVEIHGATMAEKRQNVRAVVDYLIEVGYLNILHVESKHIITASNSDLAAQGHLYVSQAAG
jgi:FkbM family methyltransferase